MQKILNQASYVLLGVLIFTVTESRADTVVANAFSTSYSGEFQSYAFDPSTGIYYNRQGFDGGATVSTYSTDAALSQNAPAGSVTLQGGGFYGTYFAVSDGHLFGRADSTSNLVNEWNATTGALLATGTIPNFGGQNGTDTFDWGGYSGVNWLQDSTGLYTLGHIPGGTSWSINKMDANLNIVSTQTFTAATLGYAFVINGELFTSSSFESNVVNQVLDLASGTVTAVSFEITNLGGLYLSNTAYDPIRDRLYLLNSNGTTLFSIDDASGQFHAGSVPEPASVVLLGLGVIAMLAYERRRRRDQRGRNKLPTVI